MSVDTRTEAVEHWTKYVVEGDGYLETARLLRALLAERDEARALLEQWRTVGAKLHEQREAAEQKLAALTSLDALSVALDRAQGADDLNTRAEAAEARAATAEAKVADLQDALEIVKRHRDEEIAATDKAEARVQALEADARDRMEELLDTRWA